MANGPLNKSSSPAPLHLGFALLTGVLILGGGGIGGVLGQRLAGLGGYWIGGYLLALPLAVAVNRCLGHFQKGHLLYYAFGTAGLLLGGQFGPLFGLLLSPPHVPEESLGQGRILFFAGLTGLVGMMLGFAIAALLAPVASSPIANDPPEATRNSLGGTGLRIAVISVVLLLGMIAIIEWFAWGDRPSVEQPPRGRAPPIIQLLLISAWCFTGGVASLVGLGLSVAGLRRQPRTSAWWGLAVSLLSPTLLVCWLLVRQAEVLR
jgi:hypothetical protein